MEARSKKNEYCEESGLSQRIEDKSVSNTNVGADGTVMHASRAVNICGINSEAIQFRGVHCDEILAGIGWICAFCRLFSFLAFLFVTRSDKIFPAR